MNVGIQAKCVLSSRKRVVLLLLLILATIAAVIIYFGLLRAKSLYRVIVLPPELSDPWVEAINDLGQVVGQTWSESVAKAFMWSADGAIVFLPAPDDCSACPWAINNASQVVGQWRDPNDVTRACLWTQDNERIDLVIPDSSASSARDINKSGHIVGLYQPGPVINPMSLPSNSFYWDTETGFVDIAAPKGAYIYAEQINESDQVVGNLNFLDGNHHAFLWQKETGVIDLHDKLPECDISYGMTINSDGWIYVHARAGDEDYIFLHHTAKGTKTYGPVRGGFAFDGYDLNDHGMATLHTNGDALKIWLFEIRPSGDVNFLAGPGDRFVILDKLIQLDEGYRFLRVQALNNRGQIIANCAKFSDGDMVRQSVFLDPIRPIKPPQSGK